MKQAVLHSRFKVTYIRDEMEFVLTFPLEMNWPDYLDADIIDMNMWYKALDVAFDIIAECGGSIIKIEQE